MRSVAIVTPIYRNYLDSDEIKFFHSVDRYLPEYDHYAVTPESPCDVIEHLPGNLKRISFDDLFFKSAESYNKLLISRCFFEAFAQYNYILIAQTDSLVLSDDLMKWVGSGYDYIGAPWGEDYKTNAGVDFVSVGNGGFSLRNVASALRVLNTRISVINDYRHVKKPRWWYWPRIRKMMFLLSRMGHLLPKITVEQHLIRHYGHAEDIFWGKYARHFDPSFSVAPVEEALEFAFESDPSGSLVKTGGKLPFGCHAWARYDRSFWEKHGLISQ
jgi:hypothetical protein